jgi:hypothetical protein
MSSAPPRGRHQYRPEWRRDVRNLVITQNMTIDGAVEMLDDWFDPQL